MNPSALLRKPRLYFDTAPNATHITFDDGNEQRRNFPWLHYVTARWDYAEPELILLEIGDWLVALRGHNLAPLFQAIEEHTLLRVRAQPELGRDRERQIDSFIAEIRFSYPQPGPAGVRRGQTELPLGL